jgi:hypothetical protein
MTLVIIVLITVVTVGYLASVMLETKTAGSSLDQERAYGIAMVGAHQAMAKIRDALGPWDDPYKNFVASNPPFYWSLSPGRITRWSYSSVNPLTNIGLFSESPGTDLVNLNRQLIDGSYPIIGGSNAPEVSVKWANLLRNPTQPASATNAIVGRYAFWVDDEGAKINVNTADGTEKYTTNSLGIGSPSEVSLQVLTGTNGQLSLSNAQAIVQIARTSNFQSPREILRASGVTPEVFTNNVFSLTAYSRSPELNVFGQPKMALLPLLGTAHILPDDPPGTILATNMVLNGITLRPGNEIYPTPAQLTNYFVRNPITSNSVPVPWPLAFRAEAAPTLGRRQEYRQFTRISTGTNYCYINGALLANYLAGTNAAGNVTRWPAFQGSSATNFQQKYSPRQIDSIVAQIVSLGSKLISSDYPHPHSSDYPSIPNISDAEGDVWFDRYLEQSNCRYNNAPFLFPGWLSGQFVSGMGRTIKLSGLRMKVSAFGSSGTLGDTNNPYIPPRASMDIWLEWWLPSGFGDVGAGPARSGGMVIGHAGHQGALNSADICATELDKPPPFRAAPLPKPDGAPSYWADQLLTDDQGIDFACNPDTWDDPYTYQNITNLRDPADQGQAEFPHDDYAWYPPFPPTGDYRLAQGKKIERGSATGFVTPLRVSSPMSGADNELVPGEIRSVGSRFYTVNEAGMPMKTNAVGSSLNIAGGIAVRSQLFHGFWSDPDPVPLEAIRGASVNVGYPDFDTQEPILPFPWAPNWQMPLLPAETAAGTSTLYDRVKKSVIPVSLPPVSVPDHGNSDTSGPPVEIVLAPDDPLVNKFPGDWKPRAPNTIKDPPSGADRRKGDEAYTTYNESATSWYNAPNFDPDSYWLPPMDCGVSRLADLPGRTRIPRSARMPNIGYLQYVRTGIIPDNEGVAYQSQQGTPFRLLSYAPSTVQGTYPDWALLDLLYIPSTLIPYGSLYNPSTAVPTTNNAATNLAFFGTFGGATAGRINPNGVVIYTTNVDVPQTNVSRTLPLSAVFSGVTANHTNVPVTELLDAVQDYLKTNGPLRIPAEICNVPRIAAESAPINPTRNDLVRQILGALTTQDNVFSVWTVGQAVQKKPGSIQYGTFEPGDNVLAEVRLHFIVERYLDPGADGVYGNSSDPGRDSVVGTFDDPVDATNHPFQPRYLYRVVASEEVR